MNRFFYSLLSLFVAAATVVVQCSGTNVAGGGTIETTNGIVGSIRDSKGSSSANSVVKLFPENYDPVADSAPGASFIDTTDKNGTYRFSRIAAGSYTLLARSPDATSSMMVRSVTVTDASITVVPEEPLDRPGSIAAVFSTGSIAAGSYLYIPGTDIAASIGSDGSALLTDVPPGTISAIILAYAKNEQRNVLRDEIIIASGDTATIVQPLWTHSRRLVLNTSFTGANITGDVNNFPVLVRLSGNNFDFSQAQPDGGDLLFTGSNDAPLAHETEQWNPGAKLAEVWVKVDTIRGNDSVQSITMYWGASTMDSTFRQAQRNASSPQGSATPESNGMAVFDTADGYRGVWHMDDATDGAVFHDATVNRYDGISPDTARPRIAAGAIGKCRSFDGIDDFITMPNTADSKLNFLEEGDYTVSAWVALDSFDGAPHLVVAKGYEQYFVRLTYFPSGSPLWEFSDSLDAGTWQACTSAATGRSWTLLTGVSRGSAQLLYCNGVLVDSMPNRYQAGTVSARTHEDLSIGSFLKAINVPDDDSVSRCFFRGSIDEVRIIGAACSPAWVRLCYMNQRPDDRLVVFR